MRAWLPVVILLACDAGQKPAPKPTEVPKPPAPPPKPEPEPESDPVRPPVASDLDEYMKDLQGEARTKLIAKIETTQGTLTCELYGDKAPMTVANFIGLATGKKAWRDPNTGHVERGKPFYDGLTFHRVIPEFMIQGGDPKGNGTGGPGYDFDDEIWEGAHVGPGALAMANAGTRGGHGTNGSQFFIMEGERPDLDTRHTVFGKCAELATIKKIARVKTDPSDKPLEPETIKSITIPVPRL